MLKTSVAFLIYFLRCSDCIFISLCELYDFSVRPLDVLHINCWLTALLFANNTGCWQLLCHRILNHPNHPKEPPWIQNQQHHRADWAINTQQHFAEHVPCFSTLAAFFTHMEKKKNKKPKHQILTFLLYRWAITSFSPSRRQSIRWPQQPTP